MGPYASLGKFKHGNPPPPHIPQPHFFRGEGKRKSSNVRLQQFERVMSFHFLYFGVTPESDWKCAVAQTES